MPRVFVYVVDRDFGFAPNPFHGTCTLATCKPGIRKAATVGDWVIGMGGRRLKAVGRCVFAMRVDHWLSFDDYWSAREYRDKKPVRNGSRTMIVGDNIYHHDPTSGQWRQADSHHSNADGSVNPHNLAKDTGVDRVLISRHFYYFGRDAPVVPQQILASIGYKNGRSYRVFDLDDQAYRLVRWVEDQFTRDLNRIVADPFDFDNSAMRYSVETNKLSGAPRSPGRQRSPSSRQIP